MLKSIRISPIDTGWEASIIGIKLSQQEIPITKRQAIMACPQFQIKLAA